MRAQVVIPVYREFLSTEDRISLASIRSCFPSEIICFAAPQSLDLRDIAQSGEETERFEDHFFKGVDGYNRLLCSPNFYERFFKSTHILICQLDCLVFRNELDFWMTKGFDYIAAPWFKRFVEDPAEGLWRVGNGGFSLKNIDSHLRVLKQRIIRGAIYPRHGTTPWEPTDAQSELGFYRKIIPWYLRINPFAGWTTVGEELQKYPCNEDLFWSLEAPKFDPGFRIAPVEDALPFAFEMAPRWCFERNGHQLPFGCHAWARYDRTFWEGFLPELNGGVAS